MAECEGCQQVRLELAAIQQQLQVRNVESAALQHQLLAWSIALGVSSRAIAACYTSLSELLPVAPSDNGSNNKNDDNDDNNEH